MPNSILMFIVRASVILVIPFNRFCVAVYIFILNLYGYRYFIHLISKLSLDLPIWVATVQVILYPSFLLEADHKVDHILVHCRVLENTGTDVYEQEHFREVYATDFPENISKPHCLMFLHKNIVQLQNVL